MSVEWHLSKYNLFANIPNSEQIGCVNLLKGTYSILSLEEAYLLHNNQINNYFIKQGFIVNYDELQALEFLSRKNCGITNTLFLTICPTMNCNFNCSYCFEKHRIGKMSMEIQDAIISFIKRIINNNRITKLKVTWFGGEPLLAVDVINSLSKKLIEFCNNENIQYNSNIVTNGYLLTQEIVDNFFENKITSYQITLDGIGEIHNKTRHLINNGPTFDKIISNLTNLKIKGTISIRHNLHKDNTKEVEPLKKYIKDLAKKSGNNIYYYTAFVRDNEYILEEENLDFVNSENYYYYEIDKKIKEINPYKGKYCGAQSLNSIAIDELGNLYNCWEDVSKTEYSFGRVEKWNINNPIGTANNPQIMIDYINTGGNIRDEECLNCVWLPICQGGCPHRRLFYNKECISCKNKPEEFVLKFIEFKQKQKNN